MKKAKWILFIQLWLALSSGAWGHEFQLNGVKIQSTDFLATPEDGVEYNAYLQHEPALSDYLHAFQSKKNVPESFKKLEPNEISAIQAYTDDHYYSSINNVFKSGADDLKTSTDVQLLIKLILSGLNKLPSYDQGLVYRGLGWWETSISQEKYLANYKSYYDKINVGEELSFPFMSTTKDDTTVFVRCTPVVFRVMKSQNGKDISEVSTRPDEKEVLFRPFSKFKIIQKFTRRLEQKATCTGQRLDFDDQMVVDLEETTPN
jgi:hypothetical protein